jgi:predicted nucleotidyltransferase
VEILDTLTRFFQAAPPPGLISAYLFGSHAADRSHRESDVDVGILLDWAAFSTDRERFEERVQLAARLPGVLGVRLVDVVVLNDAPPHLGRRIVTHGRRVYCADADADHAYVRDVQLRAADLDPFLRSTRRRKLDALAR